MNRLRKLGVVAAALSLLGCTDVRKSWDACTDAAERFHAGDTEALCAGFSDEMLAALSCESLAEFHADVVEITGPPVDSCRWAYTYRIQSLDPLRAVAMHDCPFESEDVTLTIAVAVAQGRTEITGFWANSPGLRSQYSPD